MVQILLVEKSGTIKEINVKQFDDTYLSKKAGFKSEKGFSQNNGWSINNMHIFLYGKTEGRAGQENKYDFPPPCDNILFFGGCLLIAKNAKNEYLDLNEKLWKIIYEKLFGGFEDLGEEDSEEDEEDEDDDLSQTKQGYAKDGFVVDDNEEQDDEEEEHDDEEDIDAEDEDDGEEDDDEDDEEEVTPPKKRVQPKRTAKKTAIQNVFMNMQQEEEYMNCESELSEEEYV
tara:strand:- start:611 stop:1297 length:687 start_codon:yes stop_codon:yes gene_type:complete